MVNGKLLSLINDNDKFIINECDKKNCNSEDISLEDLNKILSANYKNKVLIKLPINDIDISIEQLKKLIKDPNLIKVKTIDLRIKDKIIIS